MPSVGSWNSTTETHLLAIGTYEFKITALLTVGYQVKYQLEFLPFRPVCAALLFRPVQQCSHATWSHWATVHCCSCCCCGRWLSLSECFALYATGSPMSKWDNKYIFYLPNRLDACKSVDPVVPGAGCQRFTQILADQLALSQPRGTDYVRLITTDTPGFSDLPTALW